MESGCSLLRMRAVPCCTAARFAQCEQQLRAALSHRKAEPRQMHLAKPASRAVGDPAKAGSGTAVTTASSRVAR
jgi:hypothetical protein